MNEKELQQLREHIEAVIEQKVNGKIDAIDKKIDAHMEEMDPFLSGWKGARAIGSFVKWVAGVLAAIGAIYWIFKTGL